MLQKVAQRAVAQRLEWAGVGAERAAPASKALEGEDLAGLDAQRVQEHQE